LGFLFVANSYIFHSRLGVGFVSREVEMELEKDGKRDEEEEVVLLATLCPLVLIC